MTTTSTLEFINKKPIKPGDMLAYFDLSSAWPWTYATDGVDKIHNAIVLAFSKLPLNEGEISYNAYVLSLFDTKIRKFVLAPYGNFKVTFEKLEVN